MKRILISLVAWFLSLSSEASPTLAFVKSQVIDNPHGNDVVLADFGGRGKVDAVIASGSADQPLVSRLWSNDGTGTFHASGQALGCAKSWSVACGRLRPGGANDVFLASGDWRQGATSQLWINDGRGRFTGSAVDFGRANSSAAALGDLNGDGLADLFLANHPYADGHGGECEVWMNDGQGRLVDSGQRLETWRAPRRIKLADVDGDGALDAVVLFADGPNVILLNDGKGRFTKGRIEIGQGDNLDLAVGDLDADGKPDVVIAKGAWGTKPAGVEIWHNEGAGRFGLQMRLGNRDVYGVALGDLTGDHALDLVAVCGPGQANQTFVNDRNGHLVEAIADLGSGGNKVAIADLNHDGLLDLLIVGDESAAVWLQHR